MIREVKLAPAGRHGAAPGRLPSWLALLGLGAAVLAGCGHAAMATRIGLRQARPLRVYGAPTPGFPVRGYVTRGTYPNVALNGKPLHRVNASLRAAVIRGQRERLPFVRAWSKGPGKTPELTFRVMRRYSYLVANSSVVSWYAFLADCVTDEVDFCGSVSTVVLVPSGHRVRLRRLFAGPHPKTGLRALRRAVLQRMVRPWPCTRVGLYGPRDVRQIFLTALTPRWGVYRHFALTRKGLLVQLNLCANGGQTVIVPYREVTNYLSPLGRGLVHAVRTPVRPNGHAG